MVGDGEWVVGMGRVRVCEVLARLPNVQHMRWPLTTVQVVPYAPVRRLPPRYDIYTFLSRW